MVWGQGGGGKGAPPPALVPWALAGNVKMFLRMGGCVCARACVSVLSVCPCAAGLIPSARKEFIFCESGFRCLVLHMTGGRVVRVYAARAAKPGVYIYTYGYTTDGIPIGLAIFT